MLLTHKIRLQPTGEQTAFFMQACGVHRFAWNWALAEWKRQYDLGEKPSGFALKKQFNSIKRDQFPWTQDIHRDATSQPFADLQKAFSSFWNKKTKYPKFKKRNGKASFYIANDRVQIEENRVRVPKLGWVEMRESLRFDGKIKGARISRRADLWFISIYVDIGEYKRSRIANGVVGVDLGVKTFATLSTGEVAEGPKPLKKRLKKIQRLSRQLSRKKKGSNNRAKARLNLARAHHRVANIRSDAVHKLTTDLCRENQTVVVEDLYVRGMLANHRLARAISDMGFAEFRRQLNYKSQIYDTNIVVADRWFPSTKRCSKCGSVKDKMLLSQRIYKCHICGLIIDRDLNAARNLEQLGMANAEVTPVETGALAGLSGETTVTEAGISPSTKYAVADLVRRK